MKNIQINKKWLNIIALLLLVISLSSCSATGYWWGEQKDYHWGWIEYENPWDAACVSFFAPLSTMFGFGDFNFAATIIGYLWFLALPSALLYLFGSTDDIGGVKNYDVIVDGKRHNVTDYSESYSLSGTGSSDRGHRWADIIVFLIFSIIIYCILYRWITGWFDELNMLFKVVIGGGIIVLLYNLRGILLPISSLAKYISWAFCSIDFILGILVTLWIY